MQICKTSFLLVFAIVTNCCFGQTYFKDGYAEYLHGDLRKSVSLFTKSIENNQNVAESYMYRGAAKTLLILLDSALSDLNVSKQMDSSNPKLYFYYGKLSLFKGDFMQAIQFYSLAIQKNPKEAFFYDERAIAKILLEDFSGGVADDDIAISIDSADQTFYNDRGFAKLKLEQYDNAIKDFTTSIRLAPNQKAFANRGLAYSSINQHEKAVADYNESLAINPIDGEIFYYRALSFQAMKRNAEACGDFKQSKELGYAQADSALLKMQCK